MIKRKQVLNTFLDLVRIDSPSGEEAKVAEYILKFFKKARISAKKDKHGNVFASIPGSGSPLMFSAHMDTVEPGRGIKPVVKGDVIKSDGTTILGADDKAGLTAIMEAAKYLEQNKIKHRPLEIVFTREEETTLAGAAKFDLGKLKAKQGIIIDTCKPLGHVLIASPYCYHINIKIFGRSAHAGSEPEKGINAIQIAGKAISDLKLGRINKNTTNNIGIIKGGLVANSVPDLVEIKAEARSHNLKEAQEQVDLINKAFKKYVRKYKAKLFFKAKLDCQGYKYSTNDKLIKEITKLNKKFGFKTVYHVSGQASDANIFASRKIKAVDISYGGANVHTVKEAIKIGELAELTNFLIDFVKIK